MRSPLPHFKQNIIAIFYGKNLLVHLAAITFTIAIVTSGLDAWYFTATQGHLTQSILFPAATIGGLIPIILPLSLFTIGKLSKNDKNRKQLITSAYAVAQAAIMGLLVSSTYKAFTGRAHPNISHSAILHNLPINPLVDISTLSHEFHFGFFQGGVFWGWPSSHTTVAFSIALTLFILFRKNPWVKYPALIIATYIAVGVSTNIHWLSDAVAGLLIGTIIGLQVGRSFAAYKTIQEGSKTTEL